MKVLVVLEDPRKRAMQNLAGAYKRIESRCEEVKALKEQLAAM